MLLKCSGAGKTGARCRCIDVLWKRKSIYSDSFGTQQRDQYGVAVIQFVSDECQYHTSGEHE